MCGLLPKPSPTVSNATSNVTGSKLVKTINMHQNALLFTVTFFFHMLHIQTQYWLLKLNNSCLTGARSATDKFIHQQVSTVITASLLQIVLRACCIGLTKSLPCSQVPRLKALDLNAQNVTCSSIQKPVLWHREMIQSPAISSRNQCVHNDWVSVANISDALLNPKNHPSCASRPYKRIKQSSVA